MGLGLALLAAGCAPAGQMVQGATWATDASALRGEGGWFVFVCPANPPAAEREHPVWGADVYTDDSSVCRAAVHAGAISYARGGRVTVEPRPGQDRYRGTDWNGVVSLDYGPWDGSFVIVR